MRVIAGSCRSMPLKAPNGFDTRPTTDRIKETLFNMLQPYLSGSVFVDLFSGSGQIGIEALSRGARSAYFVENDKNAYQCIKDNLEFTKLSNNAILLKQNALIALSMIHEKEVDVVFADPPYQLGVEKELLAGLAMQPYITDDTVIIMEALKETDFSFVAELGYTITKEKVYKTNKHVFIKKAD